MRVLTTALDKGEQKIPGEKHKANLYVLQPGVALRTSDPSEVIKITPEMAKKAEYTWCSIWREGRVLAEFALGDVLVAQPIKPDPIPKRKRGEHDEGAEAESGGVDQCIGPDRGCSTQPRAVGQLRRRAARLLLGGGEGTGDQEEAAPTARKAIKRRRPMKPLDLL